MSHHVVFVQGGGFGIDQEPAVRRILQAAGVPIDWEVIPAGLFAIQNNVEPLPKSLFDSIRKAGKALKSKLLHPPGGGLENFNIHFRNDLGLFASVRPLRNVAGLPARFSGIDIVLVREITEDLYNAAEHTIVPGVVQSIKVVTEAACRRFFDFCFQLANAMGRKSIHCIHKANILKLADGLFLDCFRRVAANHPNVVGKELIVDNACMQLVSKPTQFEMLAAGNLYGDLLSDLGAGLIGGISATSAVNHGQDVTVYEAIHGGLREWIGDDKANPLPLLMPALELVNDLGYPEIANRIRKGVEKVLKDGTTKTIDLGGTAGTKAMADAIVRAMDDIK